MKPNRYSSPQEAARAKASSAAARRSVPGDKGDIPLYPCTQWSHCRSECSYAYYISCDCSNGHYDGFECVCEPHLCEVDPLRPPCWVGIWYPCGGWARDFCHHHHCSLPSSDYVGFCCPWWWQTTEVRWPCVNGPQGSCSVYCPGGGQNGVWCGPNWDETEIWQESYCCDYPE
jgi:hypothetical protein